MKRNDSYACYREPVLAVADGEVVETNDGYPENPEGRTLLAENLAQDLGSQHPRFASLAGNWVLVRHNSGEHSLYAHLCTGTVTVRPNDLIIAGQELGKIGNSGLSGGPHLHFAFMDGPDVIRARGIPCRFDNLRDVTWCRNHQGYLQTGAVVQSMVTGRVARKGHVGWLI